MPGQPITRTTAEVIATLEEDEVWLMYLQAKSIPKLLDMLAKETGHDMRAGPPAFYRWLRAEEGREARWREIKKMRGDAAFDEVEELADNVTKDNARETQVKMSGKQWIAERLNRAEYGRDRDVNVNVNMPGSWLSALQKAEAEARAVTEGRPEAEDEDDAEEADYVIMGPLEAE